MRVGFFMLIYENKSAFEWREFEGIFSDLFGGGYGF